MRKAGIYKKIRSITGAPQEGERRILRGETGASVGAAASEHTVFGRAATRGHTVFGRAATRGHTVFGRAATRGRLEIPALIFALVLLVTQLMGLAGCGSGSPDDPYAGREPADLSGYSSMSDYIAPAGDDIGEAGDTGAGADSGDAGAGADSGDAGAGADSGDASAGADSGDAGAGADASGGIRLVPTTAAEAAKFMDQGETFVLFAGYEDCDYCDLLLPYLNDAAVEADRCVGYIDTRSDPEWKTNNDIDDFDKFLACFGDWIEPDESGSQHLYTPQTYFVKSGEVVRNHDGVLPDVTDPSRPLTETQENELRTQLQEEFQSL